MKVKKKQVKNNTKNKIKRLPKDVVDSIYKALIPYKKEESDFWYSAKKHFDAVDARLSKIETEQGKHFKDDIISFKSQSDKSDEILSILKKQNEYADSFRTEVSPMLETFKNNKITKMVLQKDGKTLVYWSAGIVGVGAAISYLWSIALKLIK